MTAPRVMVVDDDADLRGLICDYLASNGYDVSGAANSREMDAQLAQGDYDCIVLDLMMPEEDGLAVLRRLNRPNRPAIIMLSALGSDTDRIVGLELGADDYLPKPCNPRELLARVRAVLRRNDPAPTGPVRCFGHWTLDQVQRTLTRHGEAVSLTDAEFRVLNAFLDHPQQLLTRDQLIDMTKGSEAPVYDRSVDVIVSRLRKKLGRDAPIRTARNEGYTFTLPINA
ncbi:MAG: response regulator [Haliea sp.]|nr:response regulator [Haliea sp.]MBK6738051.1 response regulator [Haliea sp.]